MPVIRTAKQVNTVADDSCAESAILEAVVEENPIFKGSRPLIRWILVTYLIAEYK